MVTADRGHTHAGLFRFEHDGELFLVHEAAPVRAPPDPNSAERFSADREHYRESGFVLWRIAPPNIDREARRGGGGLNSRSHASSISPSKLRRSSKVANG